jgi:PIN domain nuclease of toxin-antitoxin system
VKLLLDTHAFLWWLAGDTRLTVKAREAIHGDSNLTYVSAASAWEIATKFRIGKLNHAAAVALDVSSAIASQRFKELPVTASHGQTAGALATDHRDPFDRMLVAQAMLEQMAFVSNETRFDVFPIKRLW